MSNAGIWQENTPYSKLLITVGLVLLSTIIFTLISLVAAIFYFHVGIDDLQALITDSSNPNSLAALKLVQTFSSIGTFVVPPLILAHLFSQNRNEYLKLNKGISVADFLLVLIAMFASLPLINYLVELNEKMVLPQFLAGLESWMKEKESAATEITEKFLDVHSAGGLVMNVVIIALIPAIGEELMFRGILQRIFSEWFKSAFWGILVSSILFSALHMQFYGFLPRMMLGILLGYMFLWSGSLWLPIAAHFINNASAVIMIYFYRKGDINVDLDKVGAGSESTTELLISTLVFIAVLWLLYRKHRMQKAD